MQNKINLYTFCVCILIISSALKLAAANYYWVGNAGDWSDLAHWASTSGGAGNAYGVMPTTSDNVFFDANSFSAGSQTITIDTTAACANLDFTGVTNTPTLGGVSTRTLTCAGSLTFVAGITYSFAGDVNFTGTGIHTITTTGKTFAQDVLFNGTGGQWTLQDAFTVTNQLGLEAGTVVMNGVAVACGTLNANIVDNVRTLNFGASTVTITGSDTCLDLRGNTANLTVNAGTATVSCTTTSDLVIEVGSETKTVPNLLFSNITTGNISINTGNTTNRITFGTITKSTAPPSYSNSTGRFYVDVTTANEGAKKTFGDINLPANSYIDIDSPDGSGWGVGDGTVYAGDIVVGDNSGIWFGGSYATLQNATFGENTVIISFVYQTEIFGTFTIGSTSFSSYGLSTNRDVIFHGPVIISGSALINISSSVTFNSTFTIGDSATIDTFIDINDGATFNGDVTIGNQTKLNISTATGNTISGLTFGANLTCNPQAELYIDVQANTTTMNNLTLNGFNAVSLNANAATNITGTMTAGSGCNQWNWLHSSTFGAQAPVSFSSPQTITDVICQDLNITSTNLTNNNGVDLANNTGITFGTPLSGQTYYWVGNTTGNTKGSIYTTGNNNNWSNPDNWALASGGPFGTSSCIPGAHDDVVFDANSFSAGAADVIVDLPFIFFNDMTWTGIPAGTTFDNGNTSLTRSMFSFGNLTWGGANMSNDFEGSTLFTAIDTTGLTITNNTTRFFGSVEFDYSSGVVWSLADDMDVQLDARGDVTITTGTLSAVTNNITLDGDWTVESAGTYTFTSGGTATVIFDAATSNQECQIITIDGSGNFNNLTVNRVNTGLACQSTVLLSTPITIDKNLNISGGVLQDAGSQINGNAANTMIMAAGTRLRLGKTGTSSIFPTNYIAANIFLHATSIVYYESSIAQTVSGIPDYGELHLINTATPIKTKTLTEPVLIQTKLFIDNENNFVDDGYQISFDASGTNTVDMDPNSKFTLGTASSTTNFPLNYTVVDFDHAGNGGTVVYNAGSAQTIEGLNGTGNGSYSHLELVQPGVGAVTKTLNANAIVRGNVIIGTDNVMDVSASNYSLTVGENWTDNGSFTERNGSVTFNGSALQTINGGGNTETFYDITFNNTNATGISISDDIDVTNSATFTDGIVTPAAAEIFHFSDNATVNSASNASYVDGEVRKTGDDAFIFPVGDDGYYASLGISAPAVNTDHFTCQYINVDPHSSYNTGSKDASLHHLSRCEYWTLDRTNGTSDVFVTLSWDSRSCGVTNLNDLSVARWDGSQWKDHGNGSTTGNTTAGTITSNAAVTAFSPFTLASTSTQNPLPVELLSFTGYNEEGVNILKWRTAIEINNDFFTLERSADGVNFEKLAVISGAGNSSMPRSYSNKDTMPFWLTYYRLKQTDYDGKSSYSPVVFIKNDLSIQIVNFYPNPSRNNFQYQIVSYEDTDVDIKIIDPLGKEVVFERKSLKRGVNTMQADVTNLSSGSYVMLVTTRSGLYKTQKQFLVR